MFRPDRIGTPNIDENGGNADTSAWAINSAAVTVGGLASNIINAVPIGEFGRTQLIWTAAARSLAAGFTCNLVQQVTITQPIDGDTVGIEVVGAMLGRFSALGIVTIPVFAKLQAAAVARWGSVNMTSYPTPLGVGVAHAVASVAPYYLTQVIHREANGTLAGTYAHGFQLYNPTGAPITFDVLNLSFGARQLNYQESIGYRDTLR